MRFVAVALFAIASAFAGGETRLLRSPDISDDHVAFVYANDIWVAGRDGGDARRLTTFEGAETSPHFSPDGRWLAFSGQYDGNTDVYVVPVEGGSPKRLTWHPGADVVKGWTPDGGRVLFASGRVNAPLPIPRFWTVPVSGGMPGALPIPRVDEGAYSPDGKHLAYQKITQWEDEFRNYRGGQSNPIRIIDLDSLEVTLETFRSGLADADLAQAVTDLVNRQGSLEAAMLTTSKIMNLTLSDYL